MLDRTSIRVVVLTGGIASGKTVASDRFAALGVPVIDTDVLAREVVEPGSPGLAAVIARFGTELQLVDGKLDRAALRRRVFSDDAVRQDLEAILHPLIMNRVVSALESLSACYCIVVIPLLVETGLGLNLADRVLVIDVDPAVQLNRLQTRDDVTEAEARKMLAAQADRNERLKVADDVIVNDGTLEDLCAHVDRLHEQYLTWCET